jgi:hypothetical protein
MTPLKCGDVDHKCPRTGRDQAVDLPNDERLSAYFEQRLGTGVGQGAHAFAAACRKNHRYHRN